MGVFGGYMRNHATALSRIAEKHLSADKALRVALAAVDRDTNLQNCTMSSILRAVMQGADLGFEAGGALGEAYLVPFKNECTLMLGYQGYVQLLYQSAQIKDVYAREVYEGDIFQYEYGTAKFLRHIPCGEDEPSKITHVYAIAETVMGGVVFEVMTRRQVESARATSRMKDGVTWVHNYGMMCRKTALRRLQKYLPKSPQLRKAEALEIAAETGMPVADAEFEFSDAEFTNGTPSKGVASVKQKLGVAPADENAAPADPAEVERLGLVARANELLGTVTPELHKSLIGDRDLAKCSIDELRPVLEVLEKHAAERAKA